MAIHNQRALLAAGRRAYLRIFLIKVFETLHPGEEPLVPAWYLKAICHKLEGVMTGRVRRLVITVPPRYLKSITATVAFVAWLLGQDPTKKILVATYSAELGRLHAEHFRTIVESAWYKELFPATKISSRGNRHQEMLTTLGGFRRVVTTTGTGTGFGGDIIILDDCMKAADASSEVMRAEIKQWFTSTVGTRLNNKREGVIISIQQRLHEDDLTAFLLDKGFDHLNLPAIARKNEKIAIGKGVYHQRYPDDVLDPVREPREVLDELRRELGIQVFAAHYQQDPVAPEGNIVRLDWFPHYAVAPAREELFKVVQSWDTAVRPELTAAYSVCTTWGYHQKRYYLLDVFRKRLEYPQLKRAVIRLRKEWRPDHVLIEDASSGQQLGQELRAEGPFRPIMWPVNSSKEDRLVGQTGQMEAGRCVLPEEAPWLEEFYKELRAAPYGRYWDQVDSMVQFLEFAMTRRRWLDQERDPVTGRVLQIRRRQNVSRRNDL